MYACMQCAALTKLDAHHNLLETLPHSISALNQLTSLYGVSHTSRPHRLLVGPAMPRY